MQIKITMRYHFIPMRLAVIFKSWKIISVGENMEKWELWYVALETAKVKQNYHMTQQVCSRYMRKRILKTGALT